MNISQKIILPAIAVILISWVELNAKADTDKKVQPQKLINLSTLTQCSEAINTDVKNCFTSPKLVNRARQV